MTRCKRMTNQGSSAVFACHRCRRVVTAEVFYKAPDLRYVCSECAKAINAEAKAAKAVPAPAVA